MTRKQYGRPRRAKCFRCGKPYTRTRAGQRFCSGACRQAAWASGGQALRALTVDLQTLGHRPRRRVRVTHVCPLCGLVHHARTRRAKRRRRVSRASLRLVPKPEKRS